MIVLTLGGGLGNQMFEYAFARKLQMQTGDKAIKLNTFHVVQYADNKEALHNLNITETTSICNSIEVLFYKYLEKVYRRFIVYSHKYKWNDKNLFYKLSKYGIFYGLTIFDYLEYQIPKSRIKFIYGVYENPKYWKDIEKIVKQELKVKTIPSSANLQLINLINMTKNSICVHIRRGDYITNPRWANLNICNEKYYKLSMDYMKQRLGECTFFIFSNTHEDIEWIRNNYNFEGYKVIYIDQSNSDYEELRLMYQCNHFIIANSTFSWWAQFLSDSSEKIVCAPSRWIEDNKLKVELYDDNWIIIDT